MSESLENAKDIYAVNVNGWIALHYAAEIGDVTEVERSLAAGANVDARSSGLIRNCTPLMIATRHKHFDIMRLLLDRGADIDARNDHGYGNEIAT